MTITIPGFAVKEFQNHIRRIRAAWKADDKRLDLTPDEYTDEFIVRFLAAREADRTAHRTAQRADEMHKAEEAK